MLPRLDEKKRQSGLVLIIIVIFVFIFGVAAIFFFSNAEREVSSTPTYDETLTENIQTETNSTTPTDTGAFPFQEMTIPYLRSQNFESSLGELEEISDNQDYASYLTSYTSEGLQVNGLLTIPKGEQPANGWPAVVFVHGYIPPQEYSTTQNYSSYVDFLARRGIVVFKIDLRGHANSEGEAHGAYYSENYVVDTISAYSALETADFVDDQKIALWGHSMAGNVVFRSFIARQDVPKVIVWAGAVYTYEDFSDYRIQDDSYQPPAEDSERRRRREELFEIYGDFDPEDEFWRQIVPTNYLNGKTGQLQIHHATNDPVVSIEYSRNLINILEGTSIGHQLFEYPSGGHNITGSSFTQAMQQTVEFIKQ